MHNGAEELAALRGALERLEELGLMEGGEEGLGEEEAEAEAAEEAEGEEGVALLRAVAAGPPLEYSFQATAEPPDQPDESGEQMAALRSYLIANPHIEFVFYDFASMPQGASPALLECPLGQAHPRGRLLS